MQIRLSAGQEALIREGLENGRLQKPEDAFEEAMLLWEERERRRTEILLAVDRAEASLARGDGRIVTNCDEAMLLAENIKKRGTERLVAAIDPRR